MQASGNKSVLWIWRHIAVALPAHWEMLQFSTEFNRGRCAFADRYQFRAELSWSVVKGEPDYQRMLSDYTSRMEHEKKLSGTELLKKAGWFGFSGEMNGEPTSRFGLYLKEIGCMVEFVFLWPQSRDPSLESDVLSSIHASPPAAQNRQRWRAFGLDMHLPPSAAFEGCKIQPARAEFSFSHPKSGNSWQFGRYGMVKSWMKTDVETWLGKSLGSGVRSPRFSHVQRHGVDVVQAEADFKPDGLHIRKGALTAAAWISREDGRLYQVVQRIRKPLPAEVVPLENMLLAAPEFTPPWRADKSLEMR